jgi:hypothetical protein
MPSNRRIFVVLTSTWCAAGPRRRPEWYWVMRSPARSSRSAAERFFLKPGDIVEMSSPADRFVADGRRRENIKGGQLPRGGPVPCREPRSRNNHDSPKFVLPHMAACVRFVAPTLLRMCLT